jgi:hypothetical protein
MGTRKDVNHYQTWQHFLVQNLILVERYDVNWISRRIHRELREFIGGADSVEEAWKNTHESLGIINPCDPTLRALKGRNGEEMVLCGCINTLTTSIQCRLSEVASKISLDILSSNRGEYNRRREHPTFVCYNFSVGRDISDDIDIYALKLLAKTMADYMIDHPRYLIFHWIHKSLAHSVMKVFSDDLAMKFSAKMSLLREHDANMSITEFYTEHFEKILREIGVNIDSYRRGKEFYFPSMEAVNRRPIGFHHFIIPEVYRYHENPLPSLVSTLWAQWIKTPTAIAQLEQARYTIYTSNESYSSRYVFEFQCRHGALIILFIVGSVTKYGLNLQCVIDYLDLFLQFNGQKPLIWLIPRIDIVSGYLFQKPPPEVELNDFFDFLKEHLL